MTKGLYTLSKENIVETPTISGSVSRETLATTTTDDDNKHTNGQLAELGEEDARNRDQWSRPLEFLLSCVASSVGLGNVWRFPFTAYENGGGAFLIPYMIILLVIGRPLYFMELSFGQFSSYGNVKVWKSVPILRGIGIGQAFTNFYVISYYVVLASTCVFYLASCFQSILPWTWCDPEWADCRCYEKNVTNSSVEFDRMLERCELSNFTYIRDDENLTLQSSTEQYNQNYVYKLSLGMHEIGTVDIRMAGCLLFCWVVLFFSVVRGVKSSGKTAYFTALFPYIVLIALLVVGVTLDGAVDGILYFITPRWEKLLEIKVWYKACEQMLFSLTVGYGVLIVYSSYNDFRHPIYRDAMIISVLDTFTSLLAGFTIFAVIGALAKDMGETDLSKVVKQGTALAFIAYPEALSRIDAVPQLWAVLFFFMMLTLAVGTLVGDLTSVLTILHDQMPNVKRWKLLLGLVCVAYGIGMIYVTNAGQFVLNIVDSLGAGFSTFVFAIGECIGLMWIYGMKNFASDVSFMLGFKLSWYWKITWAYVSPIVLTFILIYTLASTEPLTLGDYTYPSWAESIGWTLAGIALIQLPIWAAVAIAKQNGSSLKEKFRAALRPAADWGPRNPKDRREWLEHRKLEGLPVHKKDHQKSTESVSTMAASRTTITTNVDL